MASSTSILGGGCFYDLDALPQQEQMDMLSRRFTDRQRPGQSDLFHEGDPAGNEAHSSSTSLQLGESGEGKKETIKSFMAYPSTPVSENQGKTSSGNKATTTWGGF